MNKPPPPPSSGLPPALNGSDDAALHRPRRLRPSGGYRKLRSYQVATVVYDGTVSFCDRFINIRSRTHDQMVQAARSGNKNIAEGSRAAATSSQTELRLVNVARASLEELLLDYEDYLRQRHKPQWEKNGSEAGAVRAVGRLHYAKVAEWEDPKVHWQAYARWLEHADPAVVANALICLTHQANYLLDQQIAALERGFIQQGGYSEQLAAARIAQRSRCPMTDQTDPTDSSRGRLPACPACGKPMTVRTARKGPRAGSQFLGCTGYPACKGTREIDKQEQKNP